MSALVRIHALITRTRTSTYIRFCDKTLVRCFISFLKWQDRLYHINLLHFILESLYWQDVVWFSGR